MITVGARFPGGYYHATPWSTHVNEGSVEWPPSPWRLVRALVSSWHRTAPEVSADAVTALLSKLELSPSYSVPRSAGTETRHYMPRAGNRRGLAGDTGLVLDSARVVPRDAQLTITWPTDLDHGERSLLERLCRGVTYLGRSESWCDLEVVDQPATGRALVPAGAGVAAGERIELLTPVAPIDLEAISMTTADLQRQGLRMPSGAAWTAYVWRVAPPERQPRRSHLDRVAGDLMIWAIEGRPPPLLTGVSEIVRHVRRIVSLASGDRTGHIQVCAYPSDPTARPPRIDRVALWSAGSLTRGEVERAASRLGPFRLGASPGTLTPLLIFAGQRDRLPGVLVGPARRWTSISPMVVRWRELGGTDRDPASQIAAALEDDDRLRPIAVTPAAGRNVRWVEFRQPGGVGAHLEFKEPVRGPIVASRQPPGFGLFLADE